MSIQRQYERQMDVETAINEQAILISTKHFIDVYSTLLEYYGLQMDIFNNVLFAKTRHLFSTIFLKVVQYLHKFIPY